MQYDVKRKDGGSIYNWREVWKSLPAPAQSYCCDHVDFSWQDEHDETFFVPLYETSQQPSRKYYMLSLQENELKLT